MDFLLFIIVYPIVWVISRLPMGVLYFISNIIYFFTYHIFGYRKKVVSNNIDLCFPEKSNKEKKEIVKKFFKHFTDLMVESIKGFSISEKELNKRYKYKNIEVLQNTIKKGKSVILTGAHKGNWELSFYLPKLVNIPMYGAYTRLGNPYFDRKVKEARCKFGGNGFKDKNIVRALYSHQKQNIQGLYLLLSDQSPQLSKTIYWREFFGINVPVHVGTEMLAKKFNFAVVNYSTTRTKRGYFETEFELITDNPKEAKDFEITDKYYEITEKNISKQPYSYLWSHKRFKHKDKYQKWLNSQPKSKKTAS